MPADFDAYFRALAKTSVDEKTEHTDRGALELLLQQLAEESDGGGHVQHEPKHDKTGKGSPDFKVLRKGRIAGYVEVKTIDETLSKVFKSDQIKKYRELSPNLILTDYLEFIWIRPGVEVERARLAHSTDLQAKKLSLKPEAVAAVRKLMDAFFSEAPQSIGRAENLSKALAKRAALLRDFLSEELARQAKAKTQGKLHGLFEVFRSQVFHELTTPDFADAFAQMLTYGLFLARLNAPAVTTVDLSNVRKLIPGSFRLIRELVQFLEEMGEPEYRPAAWIVDEILSIVNGMDLASIQEDLSFRARKAISRKVRAGDEEEHRLFERDPFIYFYEDFLKAYDPAMRKGRGVYYTPPPVVNFIVRAVDDILKSEFEIKDGLADNKRVTVLDFACGTGTFLLEVFERIFDNIGGADSGKARAVVDEHLTKNIYGFEYLIAPYTIAHLKLSQYLADKGLPLTGGERLQVFLTNTLEPIEPQASLLLPALSAEAEEAQAIKEKPILVIVGNPPYSAASKNRGEWISNAIENYKQVDGSHFGERKHWLHDDYVKFLRFAQMKMDEVERGVVGVITNHSWLDNPTFRGMRQSLMRTFNQIYVLDLHGNAKKKERAPDGSRDENVFDIEQGVAISIFVKREGMERGIWRGDVYGQRLTKYETLADSVINEAMSGPANPTSPFYLFNMDVPAPDAYKDAISIRDLFDIDVAGLISARDSFGIGFNRTELLTRINAFIGAPNDATAEEMFDLRPSRGWSVHSARQRLRSGADWRKSIRPLLYRPFDERMIAHDERIIDWGRWPVVRRIPVGGLSLVCVRQVAEREFDHVLVTDHIADNRLTRSAKGTCYQFPLLVLEDHIAEENLAPAFRDYVDARFDYHYTPEQVFGYIYAVLHAPAYRARYAEFLRIDFPRIPFPDTREAFEALSEFGWELAQVHLLRTRPDHKLAAYHGQGASEIEVVRYSPAEQAVWINKVQRFAPVPQAVWDFHIGGYQVLDKYLKSRKGRKLSLDEINHVADVAGALQFTIDQMARIDTAYLAAFPAQA